MRDVPEVPFLEALQDVSAGNRKVPQSSFLASGQLAVVDQGRALIAGYTNDLACRVGVDAPVIVFGDHTRAIKYVDFPFAMGADGVKVLRTRAGLDTRFVYHYLRSRPIPNTGYSRHFKFLKELTIPRPALGEQERIVRVLDSAERLHALRRRTLNLLWSLPPAAFDESFGSAYATATLGDLGVDFVSGKNVLGTGQNEHPTRRIISVSAVSSGEFRPEHTKPMPADYEPPAAHRLREGDVLFGRASGSLELLGATAVVDSAPRDLFLPDKVWRLTLEPSSSVTVEYVLGVLRSGAALAFIRHHASGAAGVRNISKAKLLGYRIAVPSKDLQLRYGAAAERIGVQRRRAACAVTSSEELLASLQARAFRGEL